MTKKAKQRISYVLPLANSPGGHRLGVNGLAVDDENSILYSGGRDGAICAWDLNIDLKQKQGTEDPFADPEESETIASPNLRKTTFRAQTQAHTHWVNDLCLVQNNTGLVSASSDLTVRLWRPLSESNESPQTIGQHTDYVKCLATPNGNADWVASGGLDRKINLWDLSGAGKKLEIGMLDEESSEKGSVYALSVSRSMLASGGPESILRLWDARSGQRITKFVGHTDNIRSILINESEDTIMTASSDQTIKVWSVTAGRCMHTLTMHNDSVWSLFSDDPSLGVFYSGDRSGLVVKTDVRGTMGEFDDGLSVAVAHEHDGVTKVVASGGHIWTATASSSINRWTDVDTGEDTKLPEVFRHHRSSSASSWPKSSSPPISAAKRKEIPAKSILRISNTASYPVATTRDIDAETNAAGVPLDSEIVMQEPIHRLPEETIEGQHGLVKHKLLNNRYHVLTLDTAGDVVLWDLIRCVPIKSFGKRHLEDVEPEVNTVEAVAPWCSVDTRTGRLAVVLEEYNCFDAEIYADKLCLPEPVDFRDDQRINLGKWVLRHLFGNLVDELIRRDEAYLRELREKAEAKKRMQPPSGLQMPASPFGSYDGSDSATPRGNGHHYPQTPGMGIAVATPAPGLPDVPEEGGSNGPASTNAATGGDYFSSTPIPSHTADSNKTPSTPYDAAANHPKTPGEAEKEKEKENKPVNGLKEKDSGIFGKKNKFKMSFGSMKLGRSASTATAPEPKPASDDKDKSDTASSENEAALAEKEKEVENSFAGVIQKIHQEYDKALEKMPASELRSKIEPSLPEDTPVVKIPDATTVIIQEETSGGSKDLYRGTVGSVGEDADLIVQRAPMWLGDVLLRNTVHLKDQPKISFILMPYGDELPPIVGPEGTEANTSSRLNANRMLRVRKVLAYVAERIEVMPNKENPREEDALRPDEYMDLYIGEQKIDKDMTLASMRAHIWKGGADMVLQYRANGRKKMILEKPKTSEAKKEDGGAADADGAQRKSAEEAPKS